MPRSVNNKKYLRLPYISVATRKELAFIHPEYTRVSCSHLALQIIKWPRIRKKAERAATSAERTAIRFARKIYGRKGERIQTREHVRMKWYFRKVQDSQERLQETLLKQAEDIHLLRIHQPDYEEIQS